MRVGVLGAGQLARMLALAGIPLGMEFTFLSPEPQPCAAVLGAHVRADYDSVEVDSLLDWADVVTFENENISEGALSRLERATAVWPSPTAIRASQDRLVEKRFFEKLGTPVAPYLPVHTAHQLLEAIDALGLPAILKTRREGYDGRGQVMLDRREDAASAWESLGGRECILEKVVDFEREVSIIAVRSASGETAYYPLSENMHRDGMLHVARSRPGDPRQAQAEAIAAGLAVELGYVGVLVIEFFERDGILIANEFAPRVHNSGHWTIEGCEVSQFENHLRAITGLPLGPVGARCWAGMVNIVGAVPPIDRILTHPDMHVHVYGKTPRPKRKVGHVTVCAADEARREESLAAAIEWAS